MIPIVSYLLTASVYLTVFYLFYIVLLNNDTHYSRNRIYILVSLIISMILPAMKLDIGSQTGLGSLNSNISGLVQIGQVIVNPDKELSLFSSQHTLIALYASGTILSAGLLVINILKLIKIIKSGRQGDSRIVITKSPAVSGFSAFGFIFLSSSLNSKENTRIMEHESKHIDYYHFIDLILLKILSVIFWFNPVIYLFERSLKAIHEYQADEKMLDNGENPLSYQQLILNQVFKTKLFTIQNAFSGSTLIKKRMIMMTKEKSRKIAGLKLLLVLPVTALFIILFSCSNQEHDANKVVDEPEIITQENQAAEVEAKEVTPVLDVVEEMPTFMGGDIMKFREWVQQNVKYPDVAQKEGIQGKVFVMFVVDEDGSVSGAKIIRGVDPSLDNEALRVVNTSPQWVAGKQDGENVRVRFTISVNYQLQ